MTNETKVVGVRLSERTIDRLERFEKATGVERPTLMRAAVEAALDEFERVGKLTFPLKLAVVGMNQIYINEEKTADKTLLHYVVEASDNTEIATGVETIAHGGDDAIRQRLTDAAVESLKMKFDATVEQFMPVEGVKLPDAEGLGLDSYRAGIASNA